jgi:hypothetical protein
VHGSGDQIANKPASNRGEAPAPEHRVPGRMTQYRAAVQLVDRSPAGFLFGEGLGATTYALNLGIDQPTQRGARLAGYSDFGTVLVELGWLGIVLVAACAVALALGSLAAARRAPPGSWTRALLIGYVGVLATMTAMAFTGAPFRQAGSATLFWIVTGLALASMLQQRRADA